MPKNLEQTLFSLEDSFWYIMNNPVCYNEIIWRFFNKDNLFQMFPHVEAFFRQYRLTGNAMSLLPNNIIRGSPNSNPMTGRGTDIGILEEIEEAAEEMELKSKSQISN